MARDGGAEADVKGGLIGVGRYSGAMGAAVCEGRIKGGLRGAWVLQSEIY